MPRHRHRFYAGAGTANPGFAASQDKPVWSDYTDYEGGDQPHENRPPYYALAYICKL